MNFKPIAISLAVLAMVFMAGYWYGKEKMKEDLAEVSPLLFGGEPETIVVRAVASQYAWHFQYPGPDGRLGSNDAYMATVHNPLGLDPQDLGGNDDLLSTELVLPTGVPIMIDLQSGDVIHSLTGLTGVEPEDAIPGTRAHVSFTTADEPSQGTIKCRVMCGSGHDRHHTSFRYVDKDEYENWLKGLKPAAKKMTPKDTDGGPKLPEPINTDAFMTIGPRQVSIADAYIYASFSDEHSSWAIDVIGEELDLGSSSFEPRMYTNEIPELANLSGLDLSEAFTRTYESPENPQFIYLGAHIQIEPSSITFVYKSPDDIRFIWSGEADLNWGDDLGKDVRLSAQGPIRIKSISGHGFTDEAAARKRLEEIIGDTSAFAYSVDGEESVFVPKAGRSE